VPVRVDDRLAALELFGLLLGPPPVQGASVVPAGVLAEADEELVDDEQMAQARVGRQAGDALAGGSGSGFGLAACGGLEPLPCNAQDPVVGVGASAAAGEPEPVHQAQTEQLGQAVAGGTRGAEEQAGDVVGGQDLMVVEQSHQLTVA